MTPIPRSRSHEIIMGIDPGKTGGVALLRPDGTTELHTLRMDATNRWLVFPNGIETAHRIMIEDVGCSPQFGAKGNWGLAFAMGQIMAWVALRFPGAVVDFVRPQVWKQHFRINLTDKSTSDRRKAAAVEKAKQLFPGVTFATHDQAEALLIAEYARRMVR